MGTDGAKLPGNTVWESLGISNDFLFGKVMQDPGLCKELLERILPGLDIDHVEYPELQKDIRVDADAKSVSLDVYVKDGKGSVYDIEMQVAMARELPKRARYYQGMIDLQMIDRGEPYSRLKRSYIIFICLSDPFGRGRHKYTFENICVEDRELALGDGAAKIFLNASGTMDDVDERLRAFLDYVGGRESGDEYVARLARALKEAKRNREWRLEYMTLYMRDQENVERGIEIGQERGIRIGQERGIEIGRERGIEIGRAEGRVSGAISALRDLGMPEDDISLRIRRKFSLTSEEAEAYMRSAT